MSAESSRASIGAGANAARRGAWAESRALEWLGARGLVAIARNYRCRAGEIDLVLRDGDVLVFAEVRYRRSGAPVGSAESVDGHKQHRLAVAAEHFLQCHREHAERACRFDVLGVAGDDPDVRIDWIRDAFRP